MGKENNAICGYLDNKERFADLFNALFFQGEQIILPDALEDISEKYIERPAKGTHNKTKNKTTERIRDIQKRLRSGTILRILAVENQAHVDYTMPWRCLNYDSLEYGKQIKEIKSRNRREKNFATTAERLCGFLKSNRIIPVYTLCLYHGQEPWDGPRSLYDMMDFGEDSERWKELFADYPFRLICVNEPLDVSKFQTQLGLLFAVLPFRKDIKRLKELVSANPAFHNLDRDTMEVISVMTNNNAVEDMDLYENEDGGYSMCKALEDLKEEGRIEGRTEGRYEGADLKLIELICKKLKKGKAPEVIAEELEEDLQKVQSICQTATSFAPNYDYEKIYEYWKSENNTN